MNNEKSALTTLVHIIEGLIVLILAFWIIGVVLRIFTWIVSMVLSGILLLAIIYLVYVLIKWAARNTR